MDAPRDNFTMLGAHDFVGCRFYGVSYIGLSSIGNHVGCWRWYVPLIGAFFAGAAVWLTSDGVVKNDTYLSVMALLLGLGVVVFHVFHALSLLVPVGWAQANPCLQRLTAGTVMGEANVKRSAAHKVNEMMVNAIAIAENKVRIVRCLVSIS